jgi:L-aspartate oxidase
VRDLSALVAADPRITVLEAARAADLWCHEGRVAGVLVEDALAIRARATIISAGGAAALWSRTTNPPGSTGAGMVLAHRAGARLADLEFLQFHPTAVIGVEGREGFLVTEAIRGEGATLHGPDGERFVEELAPRDEVALAIYLKLRETGAEHVGLDMRHIDPALFPNVVAALTDAGLDPTKQRIPVAPAAHYMMGGIVTDLHARSTVPGLLAVGESACTGLHGANRLASNSLSECFVFGARAAHAALDEPQPTVEDAPAPAPVEAPSYATREAMWRHAGLERTREGLEQLRDHPHRLARLVAACALEREESRGAHRRAEHLATDPDLDHRHAVVAPDGTVGYEPWR